MDLLGFSKAPANQIHLALGRLDAAGRFLLKGVKCVDAIAQPDGVHQPECPTIMVLHYLEHAGAAIPFQRHSIRMLAAELSDIESVTERATGC